MTHASVAWLARGYDASRSGNATFTIDRSRAAMNAPTAVTANTTEARGPSLVAGSDIAISLVSCLIELTLARAHASRAHAIDQRLKASSVVRSKSASRPPGPG